MQRRSVGMKPRSRRVPARFGTIQNLPTMHKELQAFVEELDDSNRRVEKHPFVPGFRLLLKNVSNTQDEICAL
jgi:hypothetical protein